VLIDQRERHSLHQPSDPVKMNRAIHATAPAAIFSWQKPLPKA